MIKVVLYEQKCGWNAYDGRPSPPSGRAVFARRFKPNQVLHTTQRQGEGWGARVLASRGSYQSTAHPLLSKKSSQASLRSRLGRRSEGSRCSLVTGSVLERLRCSRMLALS